MTHRTKTHLSRLVLVGALALHTPAWSAPRTVCTVMGDLAAQISDARDMGISQPTMRAEQRSWHFSADIHALLETLTTTTYDHPTWSRDTLRGLAVRACQKGVGKGQ